MFLTLDQALDSRYEASMASEVSLQGLAVQPQWRQVMVAGRNLKCRRTLQHFLVSLRPSIRIDQICVLGIFRVFVRHVSANLPVQLLQHHLPEIYV